MIHMLVWVSDVNFGVHSPINMLTASQYSLSYIYIGSVYLHTPTLFLPFFKLIQSTHKYFRH